MTRMLKKINPVHRPKGWCTRIGAFASVGLLLASCGGGGGSSTSAGIGGTGIVVGRITDFGSVYVNGQRFETATSQFIVDGDNSASQADLALGMVARLTVETLNGAFTGKATQVSYDDEVEGPIATITPPMDGVRTLTLFGQTVTIDENNTLFEGRAFVDLAVDDVIEVSGFRLSDTEIRATYVEFKGTFIPGTTEAEIRGVIGSYMMGPPETFVVDGVTVTTDAMTEIEVPGGMLQDGLFVEVEGILQSASTMLATRVEFEDEDLGDEVDDVELQGIISSFNGLNDFEIDGQPIDASGAQITPAGALLADGIEVEVEGDIQGGILVAEEVEVNADESQVTSIVSSVDAGNGSFEVTFAALPGSVMIRTDAQTTFEDETEVIPLGFSINDLNAGDYVKVEGTEDSNQIIAKVVKRADPEDLSLQGAVDDFDTVTNSWIEILGIRYNVDGMTEYEDGTINAATFFSMLTVGRLVEIEDDNDPPGTIADGIADEVEFED